MTGDDEHFDENEGSQDLPWTILLPFLLLALVATYGAKTTPPQGIGSHPLQPRVPVLTVRPAANGLLAIVADEEHLCTTKCDLAFWNEVATLLADGAPVVLSVHPDVPHGAFTLARAAICTSRKCSELVVPPN